MEEGKKVVLRTQICVLDRTVFGMEVRGQTIAQAAKTTALAFAENRRIDLWEDPVIRVEVISNERKDVLDVRLSVKAEWINPREGVED